MGRPVQKRKIGAGAARIEVTAARFSTGGVVTGSDSDKLYIERQRGSNRFKIKQLNTDADEVLTLVGKATPAAGEFCIVVQVDDDADGNLDDSALYYVTRLHNRTVSCQPDDDPSNMIHLKYQLATEATDEGLAGDGFTIANIDVQ